MFPEIMEDIEHEAIIDKEISNLKKSTDKNSCWPCIYLGNLV